MRDERVLVGTTDGLWDAGASQRIHFDGREVRSLVASDSGPLAILDSREVWRADGSDAWRQIASLETSRALCLSRTASQVFVGTSESHLFALRDRSLEAVPSFETAQGREGWYTPWGGPPDIRSIAVDPSGAVYVNVHVGGIVRSTDGGGPWEPTIDIDADVHEVLYDAASGSLLAASAVGLGVSGDRGESWRFYTEGLHDTYLRAVAVAGDTVLVTASTGPSTRRGAIYRWAASGGESLERCRHGLPEWFPDNIDTFCLSASNLRAVIGTSDGQVFVSSDRGQSWDAVAEHLPRILCVTLAKDA